MKHLLDQTDDYISTINRMVQAQRMEAETMPEGAEEEKGETVRALHYYLLCYAEWMSIQILSEYFALLNSSIKSDSDVLCFVMT